MIGIEVQDRLSPAMRHLAERLDDQSRVEASRAMGEEVRAEVAAYMFDLAGARHATAARLGASPSGFLGQAAEAVNSARVSVDSDGVTLSMRHPAFARAFRDIEIRPKRAKSLAIPVHAIAYNRRPAQIWDALGLFTAKGMIFMRQGNDQPPLALYILVRSVTQKQDRSLFPSHEQLLDAAARGLRWYLMNRRRDAA